MTAYTDLIKFIDDLSSVEVLSNLPITKLRRTIQVKLADHTGMSEKIFRFSRYETFLIAQAIQLDNDYSLTDNEIDELGAKIALLVVTIYKHIKKCYDVDVEIIDFINYFVKNLSFSLSY